MIVPSDPLIFLAAHAPFLSTFTLAETAVTRTRGDDATLCCFPQWKKCLEFWNKEASTLEPFYLEFCGKSNATIGWFSERESQSYECAFVQELPPFRKMQADRKFTFCALMPDFVQQMSYLRIANTNPDSCVAIFGREPLEISSVNFHEIPRVEAKPKVRRVE